MARSSPLGPEAADGPLAPSSSRCLISASAAMRSRSLVRIEIQPLTCCCNPSTRSFRS
jgi:hypothetical protein